MYGGTLQTPTFANDPSVILPEVRRRLTGWQQILSEESTQARQMLRSLLRGRLVFIPPEQPRGVRFSGQADLGGLLTGLLDSQALASPTAIAHLAAASFLRGHVLRRAA